MIQLHQGRVCNYCGQPDWSGLDCCEDCSEELARRFAAGEEDPDIRRPTTEELNAWDYTTSDYTFGNIPSEALQRIYAERNK